jgi:hypothetical protein
MFSMAFIDLCRGHYPKYGKNAARLSAAGRGILLF